jgi:hypothetical protein
MCGCGWEIPHAFYAVDAPGQKAQERADIILACPVCHVPHRIKVEHPDNAETLSSPARKPFVRAGRSGR